MLRARADPAEPWRMRWVVTLMIVLLAGGSVVAWIYLDHKQEAEHDKKVEAQHAANQNAMAIHEFFSQEPVDVTAAQLIKAYRTNEVGARDQYLGKPLRIDGHVDRITVEKFGAREFPVLYFAEGGACVFNRGETQPELGKFKKGQRVTLLGQPRGPQPGGVEHLTTHCTIDEFYE
jgi:hypothetical protein